MASRKANSADAVQVSMMLAGASGVESVSMTPAHIVHREIETYVTRYKILSALHEMMATWLRSGSMLLAISFRVADDVHLQRVLLTKVVVGTLVTVQQCSVVLVVHL